MKGKFYVQIVSGFMIVILILAVVTFSRLYNKHSDFTKNLGEKQGAIMDAVREGERIELYVEQSSILAAKQTAVKSTCGDLYIASTRLLGSGTCEITGSVELALNTYLAQYPKGALALSWNEILGNPAIKEAKKRIPIGGSGKTLRSFAGPIDIWPTGDRRITSLFGYRQTNIAGASTQHPGLDIGTYGAANTPIISVGSGMASWHPDRTGSTPDQLEDHYILVQQDNGLIIRYMHVLANTQGVQVYIPEGESVRVERGQIIGTSAPHRGGPHLHLEVRLPGVDRDVVESIWGTEHVSYRTDPQKEETYAVVTNDGTAYLNPICFFDRELITDMLQQSGQWKDGMFDVCYEYEEKLSLSTRVESGATTEVQTTSSESVPAKVAATETKLNQQQLMPFIEQTANENEIEKEFMLAVITQESQGDPLAVSWTGCAGIAQFCYQTASSYPEIFQKLTPCQCQDAGCKIRACTVSNDDRFNAQKSIQAEGKLLKSLLSTYKNYDQKNAFAAGAYNGGPCAINQAISVAKQSTGNEQPTWADVKAALQGLPTYICSGIDKNQITDYVDKVLEWYNAWGGRSLSGTLYAGEQIGYYDLRLVTNAISQDQPIQLALQQLHQSIISCTHNNMLGVPTIDTGCVELAIYNANNGYVVLTNEPLTGSAQCSTPDLQAELYFGEQIEQCKQTPDTNCICPLQGGVPAKFKVTNADIRLSEINGQTIMNSAPIGALNTPSEGESESGTDIQLYQRWNENPYLLPELTLDLTNSEITRDIYLFPDQRITGLYKTPQGIGLISDSTDADMCVMPLPPQAYCMQGAQSQEKMVFFLPQQSAMQDPALEVANAPVVGTVEDLGALIKASLQAPPYPAIMVQLIDSADPQMQAYATHYLPVQDYDANRGSTAEFSQYMQNRAEQGISGAWRVGNNYEIFVPAEYLNIVAIYMLDENMRPSLPSFFFVY